MTRSTALVAIALLLLVALPAAAASPAIRAGIDPWKTIPDGTKVDFRHNPLPAGFFCTASAAYNGQIWMRGVPLTTDNERYSKVDTIIQRLDNAVFNRRGVAETRIQVRALQLEGIKTLKNVCGEYYVQATLEGEQPITKMRIVRESQNGGRFFADLKLNTKIVFTRVDNPSERLEFSYPVHFSPSPYHHWTYRDGVKQMGEAMIDSDWDGSLDARVPGTSNFSAGTGMKTKFEGLDALSHDQAHLVQQAQ